MSQQDDSRKNVKQQIILDTNILQYLGNKNIGAELLAYLLDLVKREFGLSISMISVYESLAGVSIKKETNLVKTLSLFQKKEITEEVLIACSRLTTLYAMGRISNTQITTEDKVIAATAILTGSLIMTANVNDFPRPFFREAEERLIFYKHKDRKRMIPVYLLTPNLGFITQRFSERPV